MPQLSLEPAFHRDLHRADKPTFLIAKVAIEVRMQLAVVGIVRRYDCRAESIRQVDRGEIRVFP